MGFFKKLGRPFAAVATGGLSEFGRSDPFGAKGAGQYTPIIAGAGLGALFGNPMLGAQLGAGMFSARQQADAQQEANAQNVALAREQMSFQERMSSTAHQREVADLRAAGLNPLLSVNSGASSPGGATTTVAPIPSVAAGTVSSAMDALRFKNEVKATEASARNLSAQAGLSEVELRLARNDPNRYFALKYGVGDAFGGEVFSSAMKVKRGMDNLYTSKLGVMDQTPYAPAIDRLVTFLINRRLRTNAKKRR